MENEVKKSTFSGTLFAESEGFEPPVRTGRTADFESAPFDHSGSFPLWWVLKRGVTNLENPPISMLVSACKGSTFFLSIAIFSLIF